MAHAYGATLVDLARVSKQEAARLAMRRDKIDPETFASLGILERRSAADIPELTAWLEKWGKAYLPRYGANLLAVLVKRGGETIKVRYWHYSSREESEVR